MDPWGLGYETEPYPAPHGTLGLPSPFGHSKSLFPAAEQVISSAALSFWHPWHCQELRHTLGSKEKSPPWLLHFVSFSNFFRQFPFGIFENLHDRYLYIPVKSTRYFKLHFILRKCWDFQLNSKRQLRMFTRARSSQIPANPFVDMSLCWERRQNAAGWDPFWACLWENNLGVQSCCLAGLCCPLCDREGKMNYLCIWIICGEVEWISVQKQTRMNE